MSVLDLSADVHDSSWAPTLACVSPSPPFSCAEWPVRHFYQELLHISLRELPNWFIYASTVRFELVISSAWSRPDRASRRDSAPMSRCGLCRLMLQPKGCQIYLSQFEWSTLHPYTPFMACWKPQKHPCPRLSSTSNQWWLLKSLPQRRLLCCEFRVIRVW